MPRHSSCAQVNSCKDGVRQRHYLASTAGHSPRRRKVPARWRRWQRDTHFEECAASVAKRRQRCRWMPDADTACRIVPDRAVSIRVANSRYGCQHGGPRRPRSPGTADALKLARFLERSARMDLEPCRLRRRNFQGRSCHEWHKDQDFLGPFTTRKARQKKTAVLSRAEVLRIVGQPHGCRKSRRIHQTASVADGAC
jgi:hypothetical protein